ncbi:damage-inducible protein DinB [Paenibacillus sp. HJL G12]|uniref:Damage-inducible protein DinB n=1 Tax=Paenibacillus dendrobii TaxID=2691084 RepID=A0A7X3LEJ2_9BACL|nr:DinB family protein [Paenibacillus dendrobii]MWV42591.1 damage-inducible protein DinB [Paenibacillus dendrobii]
MVEFKSQYELIQHTRESLFRFCETLSRSDYVKEVETFGGVSIRSLHAHVADCYRVWLGNRALGKSLSIINPESVDNVQEMREVFKKTDALVYEFLNEFKNKWDPTIQASWQSGSSELTELWLFTHTITHEFHHRGQIVKMGRQLGYIPPKMNLAKP